MYVFKCMHGNAPKYLSDFISHRLKPVAGPITRLSNDSTLIVANVGRNCIDDKSFFVTAPRLWNALSRNIWEAQSLTVFKKMLKSHLYPKYWIALCLYLHCFLPLRFDLYGKAHYVYLYLCMYVRIFFWMSPAAYLYSNAASTCPLIICQLGFIYSYHMLKNGWS